MVWRNHMLKFKSWKARDKWLFLLTMGVILCILAFPVDRLTGTAAAPAKTTKLTNADAEAEAEAADKAVQAAAAVKSGDSYEAELERRVREILKTVDGVGEVDVMIIVKSSSEKVLHMDHSGSYSLTEETDSNGGTRRLESENQEDSTVLTTGDNKSAPIIEKEIKPELSGIIISATGGGSPTVRAEISAAMEALFDLPAHKIRVLKRVK